MHDYRSQPDRPTPEFDRANSPERGPKIPMQRPEEPTSYGDKPFEDRSFTGDSFADPVEGYDHPYTQPDAPRAEDTVEDTNDASAKTATNKTPSKELVPLSNKSRSSATSPDADAAEPAWPGKFMKAVERIQGSQPDTAWREKFSKAVVRGQSDKPDWNLPSSRAEYDAQVLDRIRTARERAATRDREMAANNPSTDIDLARQKVAKVWQATPGEATPQDTQATTEEGPSKDLVPVSDASTGTRDEQAVLARYMDKARVLAIDEVGGPFTGDSAEPPSIGPVRTAIDKAIAEHPLSQEVPGLPAAETAATKDEPSEPTDKPVEEPAPADQEPTAKGTPSAADRPKEAAAPPADEPKPADTAKDTPQEPVEAPTDKTDAPKPETAPDPKAPLEGEVLSQDDPDYVTPDAKDDTGRPVLIDHPYLRQQLDAETGGARAHYGNPADFRTFPTGWTRDSTGNKKDMPYVPHQPPLSRTHAYKYGYSPIDGSENPSAEDTVFRQVPNVAHERAREMSRIVKAAQTLAPYAMNGLKEAGISAASPLGAVPGALFKRMAVTEVRRINNGLIGKLLPKYRVRVTSGTRSTWITVRGASAEAAAAKVTGPTRKFTVRYKAAKNMM